jgi:Ca2+-binding EF-hand superfamily protein
MDVSIHCAAIDADGDGEITVEELEAVLIRNGMADYEKVADIVKEIDTNNVSSPELDIVKCLALYSNPSA